MDIITYQNFAIPEKVSEYAIYTYRLYDDKKFGVNKWQKYKTVKGFNRAVKEAKVLHRSKKFQKIEVKQRYFDKNLNRSFSKTLKVFEDESNKYKKVIYGAFLVISILMLIIFALQ